MQLKDLEPGEMFRRPTGTYRYVKSNTKDEGGPYTDCFCFNLDGQSKGYNMPGGMEVIKLDPTSEAVEEETAQLFYMCYVQGASFPTRKHDGLAARQEAERLARRIGKEVYVLRTVACVTFTPPARAGLSWKKIETKADC